jgi:glutathione peroxidase-family protein
MSDFHDQQMISITGEAVSFDQYEGKVCLVVNVASA